MLPCAEGRRNGCVAGGKEQARTRAGLGSQRLDIAGLPHVVYYDERGLPANGVAVLGCASQFVVVASEIIFQSLADFAQTGHYIVGGLAPGCDPDDAIRESLLDDLVVTQNLSQDRFANAAHSFERSERDLASARIGDESAAQGGKLFGPRHEVCRQRWRCDVGVAIGLVESEPVASADVFEQLL